MAPNLTSSLTKFKKSKTMFLSWRSFCSFDSFTILRHLTYKVRSRALIKARYSEVNTSREAPNFQNLFTTLPGVPGVPAQAPIQVLKPGPEVQPRLGSALCSSSLVCRGLEILTTWRHTLCDQPISDRLSLDSTLQSSINYLCRGRQQHNNSNTQQDRPEWICWLHPGFCQWKTSNDILMGNELTCLSEQNLCCCLPPCIKGHIWHLYAIFGWFLNFSRDQ